MRIETYKVRSFEERMREYTPAELWNIAYLGAAEVLPDLQSSEAEYSEFDGELWAIIGEEAERRNDSVLHMLLQSDSADTVNDGDTLRQFVLFWCMEHVARRILDEPEEEEEVE